MTERIEAKQKRKKDRNIFRKSAEKNIHTTRIITAKIVVVWLSLPIKLKQFIQAAALEIICSENKNCSAEMPFSCENLKFKMG